MSDFVVVFDAFVDAAKDISYVIKACAIADVHKPACQQFDFKPPYEFARLGIDARKQNNYLTRNHHGLSWEDGTISYDQMWPVIKSKLQTAHRIFTKGDQPARYLSRMLGREVHNVEKSFADEFESTREENEIRFPKCLLSHDGLMGATQRDYVIRLADCCCFSRCCKIVNRLKYLL